MDKNTLSQYGWVVIVIIVLVILMSFAAPFGQYFYDSTMAMVESLKSATNIEKLFTPNDSENGGAQEVVTSYTPEQIEADEHLYAIGATKPEYVVAEFNEDFTEVTIFKNGENSDGLIKSFSPNSSPMTEHSNTLIKATYKEGIVNTGAYAFYDCALLSEVQFPNSLKEINHASFCYNDSLKEIVIPENVELIDYYAFLNGSSLSSVTFKTNVLNIIRNGAFDGCVNLTEISIPEGVTSIGNEAFKNCVRLVTVELPSTLQKIGAYAFSGCYRMTTANIPDSVTVIENNAFDGCRVLENIKLPSHINSLGLYAFKNCLKLESIYIPSTLKYCPDGVFKNCTNLKKVEIAPIEDDSLRTLYTFSGPFTSCPNIEEIILPDNKFGIYSQMFLNTAFYNDSNNWDSDSALYINNQFFECKSTTVTEYTIKDGTISVAEMAFGQNSQLTSITIPTSVQYISNRAFHWCSSLSTIYGESGSYAETWASSHGYTFVAI